MREHCRDHALLFVNNQWDLVGPVPIEDFSKLLQQGILSGLAAIDLEITQALKRVEADRNAHAKSGHELLNGQSLTFFDANCEVHHTFEISQLLIFLIFATLCRQANSWPANFDY